MKIGNIFLLIVISVFVSCSSPQSPEIVASEVPVSPSQPAQASPTSLASITMTVDTATSSSPVSSTEISATSQISPIVTPFGAATAVEAASEVNNGAEGAGRRAVFPNTIVVYQKESPDSQQKLTVYHTGRMVAGDGSEHQIQSEQVKPLFDMVESSEFWALDDEYSPSMACADCVKQIVTVYYNEDIKAITVIDTPVEMPQLLRSVLDRLAGLSSP
ncbi:MAG: hypothetical protein KDJ52_10790 [Anaerolineae bacterium]|nr:hypothetical protein [Anaerolineae bacterium]